MNKIVRTNIFIVRKCFCISLPVENDAATANSKIANVMWLSDIKLKYYQEVEKYRIKLIIRKL
jgi:hypothetical protein